ncbi:hypothetical protein GCM10020331_066730 [Ectobacillus funiculus]
MYRLFTGFIRAIAILLGLIFGTIAASFMGKSEFSSSGAGGLGASAESFFYFGTPTFELTPILTMILVACVGIVEATGVYFALSDICGKRLEEKDLAKGYRAEGIAIILGGLFNSFPYTTYSQKCWSCTIIRGKKSCSHLYMRRYACSVRLHP